MTPGWERIADHAAPESFNNGCYVTLWPNTMLSVFAGYAATFRLTPSSPTTTSSNANYLWHPSVSDERRKADYEATRRVVEQDLEMCEAVQRTYDGGLLGRRCALDRARAGRRAPAPAARRVTRRARS